MRAKGKTLEIDIGFNPVLGEFLRRVNRFKVLVEINGEEFYAHLPNSGRLTTALHYGAKAYLRKIGDARLGKNPYRLFAIQRDEITIIVDAQFSNILAKTAVEFSLIEDLAGYRLSGENFKADEHSRTRLDLMLERGSDKFYVEVKSVTHVINCVALFPDAPTVRGRKHVQKLTELAKCGFNSGIIFSVQRPDAAVIKPNAEVDPQFTELLREAVAEGVKIFTLNSIFQPPRRIKIEPNKPAFTF